MKSCANDVLIGMFVLLAGCALLVTYAGSGSVIYVVWCVVYGFVVLRLNRAESKVARVISIVLMPALLWIRFLPRSVKEEIQSIGAKDL